MTFSGPGPKVSPSAAPRRAFKLARITARYRLPSYPAAHVNPGSTGQLSRSTPWPGRRLCSDRTDPDRRPSDSGPRHGSGWTPHHHSRLSSTRLMCGPLHRPIFLPRARHLTQSREWRSEKQNGEARVTSGSGPRGSAAVLSAPGRPLPFYTNGRSDAVQAPAGRSSYAYRRPCYGTGAAAARPRVHLYRATATACQRLRI